MAKKKPITVTPSQFNYGHKVCRNCGTVLNSSVKHCTTCGKNKFFNTYEDYRLTTLNYCSKCGLVNEKGYKCCPDCGRSKFVSYDKSNGSKKAKKTLKVLGILLAIAVFLALLAFGILSYLLTDGETWTGLLIMFTVYTGFLLIAFFCMYYYIPLALTILTMIAFIPLTCITKAAVWGMVLSFACMLCNLIGTAVHIRSRVKAGKVRRGKLLEYIVPFIVINILCIAEFIIGTIVVDTNGWALYFNF